MQLNVCHGWLKVIFNSSQKCLYLEQDFVRTMKQMKMIDNDSWVLHSKINVHVKITNDNYFKTYQRRKPAGGELSAFIEYCASFRQLPASLVSRLPWSCWGTARSYTNHHLQHCKFSTLSILLMCVCVSVNNMLNC